MIRAELTTATPTRAPRFLTAIDTKKAFDAVLHRALTQGAICRGIEGRCLDLVRSFLENSLPGSGWKCQRQAYGKYGGDATGSSHIRLLFNMVTTDLALELQEAHGLHFTIYADDVSLWTIGGPIKTQQAILQKAPY